MLESIIAILGGSMASYSLLVSKKPDLQEYLDKVRPYQEWMGVVLTFWGVRGLLNLIFKGGIHSGFLRFALYGVEFVVGFLLAYALISRYLLEKNETARIRGEALRATLKKYQEPAGIALIVLGILALFRGF